ncbi:MAG: response regulator transcription factor [Clostridia bacterium]|nr:response regulator transcription factor [Clostridia bacterium]
MSDKKKILVIEDEKQISKILTVNLNLAGYETDAAYDGKTGLEKALTGNFDLILLDIMLPGMDGFEVCKNVRKTLDTPIIMVTAREDEIDKILGLDLGADDYVTKPFSINILLARVKANIRRFSGEVVETKLKEDKDKIVIRDLVIDTKKYAVTKGGKEIELSNKEYEVLLFLATHIEEVFSREELYKKVWEYDVVYGDMRTVDVTITRLRSKIEENPSEPVYILTKRTKGWYITQ